MSSSSTCTDFKQAIHLLSPPQLHTSPRPTKLESRLAHACSIESAMEIRRDVRIGVVWRLELTMESLCCVCDDTTVGVERSASAAPEQTQTQSHLPICSIHPSCRPQLLLLYLKHLRSLCSHSTPFKRCAWVVPIH